MGLTIGLAACLLVATVVIDDLSYDRQWKRAKDIYRIVSVDNSNINAAQRSRSSFTGLGPSLKKDFPEVEDYCRISLYKNRIRMGPDKDGVEIPALVAEPSVWKLFDFDIIQGNPKKFVKGYINLIITEKMRNQYFPNSNPIGKVVTNIPTYGKPDNYLITGIIKKFPANTNLRSDAIMVAESKPEDNRLYNGSGTYVQNQYLLFKPGTSIKQFQIKMNTWYKKQTTSDFGRRVSYELQPVTDVYLHSEFDEYSQVRGSIRDVYIFSVVAIMLLLIACINFVNLTTARAIKRVREVGIRKVLGAGKKELIAQFLCESLLFFAISFLLSIGFYQFFTKPLEAYLGHSLTLNLTASLALLAATSMVVLLVSLFTGLYPACSDIERKTFCKSRLRPAA